MGHKGTQKSRLECLPDLGMQAKRTCSGYQSDYPTSPITRSRNQQKVAKGAIDKVGFKPLFSILANHQMQRVQAVAGFGVGFFEFDLLSL
jgi:hypothetical protein